MPQPIYRDWTRSRLDAELNLRQRWPEHPEIFEDWARRSRAVRETRPVLADLAYGSSQGERLDLFPVPDARSAPLLAFIHGGYWQAMDKGDFGYLAPAFLERGVAFAALNYDLAPKARLGTMVEQARSALAWLYRHARDYGIDPERLVVAGHSAGGHLAVEALDRGWPAERDLPADLVKAGVSISGVYDLEPIRLSYHQAVLRLSEEEVAQYSPARRPPREAGPLVFAVGAEETEEFLLQQREFAAIWERANLRGEIVDLPNRHHFAAVDALGEAGHPLFEATIRLIEETAPGRPA